MSVGQRFKRYLKIKEIEVKDAAIALEVSNPTLYSFFSGKFSSKMEIIEKMVEAYPDLNIDWLFTGRGDMLKENDKLLAVEIRGGENDLDSHRNIRKVIRWLTSEVKRLSESVANLEKSQKDESA